MTPSETNEIKSDAITDRLAVMRAPNNTPYIIAVVCMIALGVVGVIAITLLRPTDDNTILIGGLLGFIAPTTLSLLAFMKSQETHLSVNSRLEEFMRASASNARFQGIEEGRVRESDSRADILKSKNEAAIDLAIAEK